MHKLLSGVAVVLLALMFTSLGGCGTSEQQADHAAQNAVDKADQSRASAANLDDLNKIQKIYDDLARDPNLSKQMQILVRSRQAQLRMERVTMMVADLRLQESAISRNIEDINRLAMQIAAAQSSVDALNAYEPSTEIDKLKSEQADIQGSADKLTRMMQNPTAENPNGKVTSPTLFSVSSQIDALTGEIQRAKADSDAARKLSSTKGDEAEMFLRKAEGESGEQQVNDSTKAAEDRRDAALADSKADMLKVEMARMQASLEEAQDQKASLDAAVKTLDAEIQAQNTRWATVKEQMDGQKKIQQELIGAGEPENGSVTLSLRAQELATALQTAAALREKINTEVNAVIPQLSGAIAQANLLRTQWMTDLRERQDDPDAAIWRQAEETLHPAYFNLEMASAMEAKASMAAAKTRIDLMIARMFDGFEVGPAEAAASKAVNVPGLTALLDARKTGIPTPSTLGDIAALKPDPDTLKQEEDDTNKAFDDTVQAYDDRRFGATDSGPAADQRRNVALMGDASVNREWARFSELIGDTSGAQNHLHAAEESESQIDPTFRQLATTANPAAPQRAPAAGIAQ